MLSEIGGVINEMAEGLILSTRRQISDTVDIKTGGQFEGHVLIAGQIGTVSGSE